MALLASNFAVGAVRVVQSVANYIWIERATFRENGLSSMLRQKTGGGRALFSRIFFHFVIRIFSLSQPAIQT